VSAGFAVTVLPEETEPAEEKIPVSDIEIGDYKEELEVDGTMTLSATVLPDDATDSKVTYRSSDPAVATVKSSGEVKGIAPGSVTIYVTAGGVTREARFTVKVSTKAITMNQDYLVCKPGDTCQLEGKVSPADAVQTLTYRTLDGTVAEVTEEGLVRAVGAGNTSILVTNGDLQTSVTVIVNEGLQETGDAEEGERADASDRVLLPERVSVKEYPLIGTQMLEMLYETGGTLQVQGKGYRLLLSGSQIVNYHNELETDLKLTEEPYGYSFTVNGGKRLCGTVRIIVDRDSRQKGYLYLYNDRKEKYELVGTTDGVELTVDTGGTYLYSAKKLSGFSIPPILIVAGLLAILAGTGIYIGTKKRYWFW
ncbi:MAG: Ig-like domain-containing protein, partial [Lachnospiraceae bacterium]|nr:Ig-like domain-containing protein [Lachnospiraceae bacterium]